MKENEARDILGMLKAATTQYPLDQETIGFWLDGLTVLDAEIATKAVLTGIRTWEQFPPWASFYEAYRMMQRQEQAAVRERQDESRRRTVVRFRLLDRHLSLLSDADPDPERPGAFGREDR